MIEGNELHSWDQAKEGAPGLLLAEDLEGVPTEVLRQAFLDLRRRQAELESQNEKLRQNEQRVADSQLKNITERKRQELLSGENEALAAKAHMAAYVAHEINGPLAGIKSAFALLQTAIPADHTYRSYVGLVDREIDRITAIVRMMYELYRPNEPDAQNVAVTTILQDIATLLTPRFRSHRVSLLLDPGEPGLRGSLRANLLRQVLFNLVQNAVEATPPQGIVRCSARRDGAILEIQVSDGGPGIPPGIAEKVWEQGFTTKRNALPGGMGLGLATCRRLLESLQGSIHFENLPKGGCVFTVRIPLDWEFASPKVD